MIGRDSLYPGIPDYVAPTTTSMLQAFIDHKEVEGTAMCWIGTHEHSKPYRPFWTY